MNTEKMDFYKNKLEEQKKSLEAQLDDRGRRLKENGGIDWIAKPEEEDGFRADSNENADDIEDFEINVAVITEMEQQYVLVTDALRRIADGNYGICEECGKEIEENRLDANPSSKTCIEHK